MKVTEITGVNANGANEIVKQLGSLLANFQIYYTNLRGFHWNIKGKAFFTLHAQFEKMYDDAADKIDEIAERILTLDGSPKSKFSDYLKISKVKEVDEVSCGKAAVENILATLSLLMKEEREILALASENSDEVTASIMSDYLAGQEKSAWMLKAFLED